MKLRLFQVDAFADRVFAGNPAAVCPLEQWLDDTVMQAIAAENNLSETAFLVPKGEGFELRWFTPTMEVELCGHATLASGFVVLNLLNRGSPARFATRSGLLLVKRQSERLVLELPARPAHACGAPQELSAGLGIEPAEVQVAASYLAVYEHEEQVRALAPDFSTLARLAPHAVIATAPGQDVDFVSRYFAPAHGIDEDPVTGSAHCTLVPYWSKRLGKQRLLARQVSARGGELSCELRGDSVTLEGRCALYLEGTINLPAA